METPLVFPQDSSENETHHSFQLGGLLEANYTCEVKQHKTPVQVLSHPGQSGPRSDLCVQLDPGEH